MASCTNATAALRAPTASDYGLLRPDEALRYFTLSRPAAAPDLSLWVERYWTVRWELPPGTRYVSEVLPHPAVNLAIESGTGPQHGFELPAALVHGVPTRRFDADLTGNGRVFGVKFRPGGFAAFTGRGADQLTDRVVPLAEVMDAGSLCASVLAAESDEERIEVMDAWLLARVPEPDPVYEDLLDVVAMMLADRSLTSVEAVCEQVDVSPRTLQRRFRHYVGTGPKWVLQRFRLHDAVRLIDEGAVDLAALAADLGWSDQAHFSREFTELVGVTPSAYARRSSG